jgi:hypothetical protein
MEVEIINTIAGLKVEEENRNMFLALDEYDRIDEVITSLDISDGSFSDLITCDTDEFNFIIESLKLLREEYSKL